MNSRLAKSGWYYCQWCPSGDRTKMSNEASLLVVARKCRRWWKRNLTHYCIIYSQHWRGLLNIKEGDESTTPSSSNLKRRSPLLSYGSFRSAFETLTRALSHFNASFTFIPHAVCQSPPSSQMDSFNTIFSIFNSSEAEENTTSVPADASNSYGTNYCVIA